MYDGLGTSPKSDVRTFNLSECPASKFFAPKSAALEWAADDGKMMPPNAVAPMARMKCLRFTQAI